MKKFLFALFLPLLSAALFAQQGAEVFDLSDDITTENEENFLDFYNNHWPQQRKATKKLLVDVTGFLKDKKIENSEFPVSDLEEFIYLDDFFLISGFWSEGFVFDFRTAAYFCFAAVFDSDCDEKTFFNTCKIIRENWNDVDFFIDWAPLPLMTSNYKIFYR